MSSSKTSYYTAQAKYVLKNRGKRNVYVRSLNFRSGILKNTTCPKAKKTVLDSGQVSRLSSLIKVRMNSDWSSHGHCTFGLTSLAINSENKYLILFLFRNEKYFPILVLICQLFGYNLSKIILKEIEIFLSNRCTCH